MERKPSSAKPTHLTGVTWEFANEFARLSNGGFNLTTQAKRLIVEALRLNDEPEAGAVAARNCPGYNGLQHECLAAYAGGEAGFCGALAR